MEFSCSTRQLHLKMLTFEHWADLPDTKTSNTGELTKAHLEKKQGKAGKKQNQNVGDQEGSCNKIKSQRNKH